jgi:hypothetical protein
VQNVQGNGQDMGYLVCQLPNVGDATKLFRWDPLIDSLQLIGEYIADGKIVPFPPPGQQTEGNRSILTSTVVDDAMPYEKKRKFVGGKHAISASWSEQTDEGSCSRLTAGRFKSISTALRCKLHELKSQHTRLQNYFVQKAEMRNALNWQVSTLADRVCRRPRRVQRNEHIIQKYEQRFKHLVVRSYGRIAQRAELMASSPLLSLCRRYLLPAFSMGANTESEDSSAPEQPKYLDSAGIMVAGALFSKSSSAGDTPCFIVIVKLVNRGRYEYFVDL